MTDFAKSSSRVFVLLARIVLRERMHPIQHLGLLLAVIGVVLVTL